MGVCHHQSYVSYLEVARTEWLRDAGMRYRDLEARGVLLAVVELHLNYKRPARYDDLLEIHTRLIRATRVQIEFSYQVLRDDELLVEGRTRLAAIDPEGKVTRLPEAVRLIT
jgi:acyl-CoA thioester hydrolase